MSTTVLDPMIPAQLGINGGVTGGVIDTVDERLPCRREDPELFFAESPSDV